MSKRCYLSNQGDASLFTSSRAFVVLRWRLQSASFLWHELFFQPKHFIRKKLNNFFKMIAVRRLRSIYQISTAIIQRKTIGVILKSIRKNPYFGCGNWIFMSRDTIHISRDTIHIYLKNILLPSINNLHQKWLSTDAFHRELNRKGTLSWASETLICIWQITNTLEKSLSISLLSSSISYDKLLSWLLWETVHQCK